MSDDLDTDLITEIEKLGAQFSDRNEIDRLVKAAAAAAKKDGLKGSAARQFIVSKIVSHIFDSLRPQFLAQGLTKAQVDALKKQIDNVPAAQKLVVDNLIELMKKGQSIDLDHYEQWKKAFWDQQNAIVNQAREMAMAPWQALSSLSSLGVLVGGISMMIGKGFDSPQFTEFGQKAMAMSLPLGHIASQAALSYQQYFANHFQVKPDAWETPGTGYSAQALQEMRTLIDSGMLSPEVIKLIMRLAPELGGAQAQAPAGVGRVAGVPTFVQPYNDGQVQGHANAAGSPSKYDSIFDAAAAQYGLDPRELKMRASMESSMNPGAVGPKTKYGQAVGIMQLTEDTAKGLGVTDRTNPEQSIFGAAKLLRSLYDKHGSSYLVDMEYYGGPDQAKWGANTLQYAENSQAVRDRLYGSPLVTMESGKAVALTQASHSAQIANTVIQKARTGSIQPPFMAAVNGTNAPTTASGSRALAQGKSLHGMAAPTSGGTPTGQRSIPQAPDPRVFVTMIQEALGLNMK